MQASFLRHIPHYDFAQISEVQGKILRTWYWLAVLSRRYSSAAQSYVLEDAQALEKAAQGDFALAASWLARVQPVIREWDDLLTIHKKYDALYRGVLNLVNIKQVVSRHCRAVSQFRGKASSRIIIFFLRIT